MRCYCCGGATFHEPTLMTQLWADGETNALQNLQSISRTFTYLGPMTGERQQGWVLFFMADPPACRVMTCSTLNKVHRSASDARFRLCIQCYMLYIAYAFV